MIVPKRAILLAAGKGTRLYPLTETTHKALVPVGGVKLFDNAVRELAKHGVDEIVVVTGDKADQLVEHSRRVHKDTKILFINNDEYSKSNNLLSLWCAREYFDEDFFLLETDVIFEARLLDELSKCSGNCAAVAKDNVHLNGTIVEVGAGGRILGFHDHRPVSQIGGSFKCFKTINIYRICAKYAQGALAISLSEAVVRGEVQRYYESVFGDDVAIGRTSFQAIDCSALNWYEIDNLNDLDLAEYRFASKAKRRDVVQARHGGYWRYDFSDHSLLYNLHYPPDKLLSHLKDRASDLIRHYPANQQMLCEHLGDVIQVPSEYLAVGNGSAEFIRMLCHSLRGPQVIPIPTFNEYINAAPRGKVCPFLMTRQTGFRLDVEAFAAHARRQGADLAVIINPNNPTAALAERADLIHFLESLQHTATTVVLDESFIEFSPGGVSNSLLSEIDHFPRLVILKSLSKTHGIGGLRLGFVASSNRALIRQLRAQTAIWNVNGFAEEYLRVFGAYAGEFAASCARIRTEAAELYQGLRATSGIEAYPTAANFVFCRIGKSWTAGELAAELFDQHDILIKDCSGKQLPDAQRYFRVASRSRDENHRLLWALSVVLDQVRAGRATGTNREKVNR